MMVFDEFPIASVIDVEGRIQSRYFPALAELAEDAMWLPNAVGVHESTRDAIPAILSGVVQVPGEKLPHFADHPLSLFTLLSDRYHVHAIETLTQLCPETVCSEGSRVSADFEGRWRSLGRDVAIASGHLFLPSELSDGLPPIDQNWGDFALPTVVRPDNWSIRDRLREQVEGDRRNVVDRFLGQLEHPLADDEFYFVHMALPHSPWIHMADGRIFNASNRLPGTEGKGWGSNSWLVEQAYQQHLVQVQYVDHVIGEVIRRLKESGSYDSSIVIVVADHGIAVRPDQLRRILRPETVGDIAAVPLFIKPPKQTEGIVDDYRAETIDILPTIAGMIEVELPWAVDGVDLLDPNRPARFESTMVNADGDVTFGADGHEKLLVAAYHSEYFVDRGPFGIGPPGYSQLLGETIQPESDKRSDLSFALDFPELYAAVDLQADFLPILLSGTLHGQIEPGQVFAVTIESRVEALTEAWDEEGVTRFQALLPPSVLKEGRNEFALYMIDRTENTYSYSLISQP
jgi:hypothetical protein